MSEKRRILSLIAAAVGAAVVLVLSLPVQSAYGECTIGACAGANVSKMLNGVIGDDLAVGVNLPYNSTWGIDVTVYNPDPDNCSLVVGDVVPAEFSDDPLMVECLFPDTAGLGQCDPANEDCPCGEVGVVRRDNGSKKKGKGSTGVMWDVGYGPGATPDPNLSAIQLTVSTRQSRGKGPKGPGGETIERYAPTSCGALYLNDGATLYDVSGSEPVACETTGQLCVAAVDANVACVGAGDPDGCCTGPGEGSCTPEPDGLGDVDNDSVADYVEACGLGTDPCVEDTEFTCDNFAVVDIEEVCDGSNDCGDYSDEPAECPPLI